LIFATIWRKIREAAVYRRTPAQQPVVSTQGNPQWISKPSAPDSAAGLKPHGQRQSWLPASSEGGGLRRHREVQSTFAAPLASLIFPPDHPLRPSINAHDRLPRNKLRRPFNLGFQLFLQRINQ